MKNLVGLLLSACFFLVVGYNVYHSGSASVNEAVDSDSRVKVLTTNNVEYEFKRLQYDNGQLVGITGKNSDVVKQLSHYQKLPNGNTVKIVLPENDIRVVHLKNKQMSTLVNLGVPVVGATGIIGLTSSDLDLNMGN